MPPLRDSASTVSTGWPTLIVCPLVTWTLVTLPAWGQGISTTALSVSSSITPSLAAISVALADQHADHVAALDVFAEFGELEFDVHRFLLRQS